MDALVLKQIIQQGETSMVQFKERVSDAYKIGCELVAFSNAQGGLLIVGVNDKTAKLKGLTFKEIQDTNNLLVNAASENVKPAIIIEAEVVTIDGQNLLLAKILKGKNKPYKDNKGLIWTKNGSDKRKVFANSELRVMLQSCGELCADRDSIEGTSFDDISEEMLKLFLYAKYPQEFATAGITATQLKTTDIEIMINAIDVGFNKIQLLQNIHLMDKKGQ